METPQSNPAVKTAPLRYASLRWDAAEAAPLTSTCVPGMARNYVGGSPAARFSRSRRLGKRQGRRREAVKIAVKIGKNSKNRDRP
jgi:hypothetical protein